MKLLGDEIEFGSFEIMYPPAWGQALYEVLEEDEDKWDRERAFNIADSLENVIFPKLKICIEKFHFVQFFSSFV